MTTKEHNYKGAIHEGILVPTSKLKLMHRSENHENHAQNHDLKLFNEIKKIAQIPQPCTIEGNSLADLYNYVDIVASLTTLNGHNRLPFR